MQINVSRLLQEPIGSARECEIDDPADLIGDGREYRVHGECSLLRIRGGILVRCGLAAEVEMECGRCLCRFRQPLKINFEEEFLPTVDITSGAPLPRAEDGGAFSIDERHILDLTEPVRQYAVTAVPMKPLCRADCAGLCPRCGKNLNQGACTCPDDEMDPRWAELSKLL